MKPQMYCSKPELVVGQASSVECYETANVFQQARERALAHSVFIGRVVLER